jgi:hypothetical protein
MIGSILELIMPLAQDAIKLGVDEVRKRADFKNLRLVLRERLHREVRLNVEIAEELGIERPKAVLSLRTAAIEQLFDQPFPLRVLFDEEFSLAARELIVGKDRQNKTYERRIEGIKTEGDLIERLWIRVAVARLRAENGKSLGDVRYIERLFKGLEASLRGGS